MFGGVFTVCCFVVGGSNLLPGCPQLRIAICYTGFYHERTVLVFNLTRMMGFESSAGQRFRGGELDRNPQFPDWKNLLNGYSKLS